MTNRINCETCEKLLVTEWTDLHGQGTCITCGTPYQVIQRDADGEILDVPPAMSIEDWARPMLKRYWQQFQRRMGLGIFLGKPKYHDDRKAFHDWIDAQPEMQDGRENE